MSKTTNQTFVTIESQGHKYLFAASDIPTLKVEIFREGELDTSCEYFLSVMGDGLTLGKCCSPNESEG